MAFKGINHMAMVTGDMEKTTIFYRDVLVMPLVPIIGNVPGRYPYRHYFFEVGDGNTIAFFEWPGMVEEFHKPAGSPTKGLSFCLIVRAENRKHPLVLVSESGCRAMPC